MATAKTKPTIQIINGETGEVIERDMTAEEITELETTLAQIAAEEAAKVEATE